MTNLTFTISTAFSAGVNLEALEDELIYDFSLEDFALSAAGDEMFFSSAATLDQGQLNNLDAAIAAHLGLPKPFAKKHLETEYDVALLVRETWWARASGNTLTLKVEETLYTYESDVLTQVETKQYTRAGAVASTRTWSSVEEISGDQRIVKKIEQ